MSGPIHFFGHTARPGGAELALRRFLDDTQVPARLVTLDWGPSYCGLSLPVDVISTIGTVDVPAALRRYWKYAKPQHVVANSMRAAFLAAITLPRTVHLTYWVRDGLQSSAMSPGALYLTKRITVPRADSFLANSMWTASTVRHWSPKADIHVVPSVCGVSSTDLARRRPRSHPGDRPVQLLFLGRLAPWKAPHVAIEAAKILHDQAFPCELTIAGSALFGEDGYVADLRRQAAQSPVRTRLTGHVTDVHTLFNEHDLLMHTSIRPEPFGQVIVQAMAHGLPVIATRGGGPSELVSGDFGVLVEPGSASALADAVQVCVDDAYTRRSAQALTASRDRVDEVIVARTDAALRDIGQRHAARSTS